MRRTWKYYASLNFKQESLWAFCHNASGADGSHCMVRSLFVNITAGAQDCSNVGGFMRTYTLVFESSSYSTSCPNIEQKLSFAKQENDDRIAL